MWCKNRQDLGKKGEDVALEYLLQRGMKLLERNWRSGHKELDLVMEEEGFIRIVEVRSRNWPAPVMAGRSSAPACCCRFWRKWAGT